MMGENDESGSSESVAFTRGKRRCCGGLPLNCRSAKPQHGSDRLQNRLDFNRGFAAGEIAFMGETTHIAFANAVLTPSELTDEQVGQMWAYLNVTVLTAENTWIAYQAGFATEGDWNDARELTKIMLSCKVCRIYWQNTKISFGAEFVDAIDADLSSSDPDLAARAYRGMLADIRQLGQDDQSAP